MFCVKRGGKPLNRLKPFRKGGGEGWVLSTAAVVHFWEDQDSALQSACPVLPCWFPQKSKIHRIVCIYSYLLYQIIHYLLLKNLYILDSSVDLATLLV